MRKAGLAALSFVLAGAPAAAVELRQSGHTIFLRGAIGRGDDLALREFLARPGAARARAIRLSSTGGFVLPAMAMARIIRAAGLATIVDGRRDHCRSACTALFVAGVSRHYVHAGRIRDGDQGPGLGFHQGFFVDREGRRRPSPGASAHMFEIYREMGAPGAETIMRRSPGRGGYVVSAATALALGIATSLAPP